MDDTSKTPPITSYNAVNNTSLICSVNEAQCSDPNNDYCTMSVIDKSVFDIKVTVNNSVGTSISSEMSGGNMDKCQSYHLLFSSLDIDFEYLIVTVLKKSNINITLQCNTTYVCLDCYCRIIFHDGMESRSEFSMNRTNITFEGLSSNSNYTFTASLVDDENNAFSDACINVIGSFMTDGEATVTPPTGNTTDPTNSANTTNTTDMTTMTTMTPEPTERSSKSVIHIIMIKFVL